MTKSSDGTPPKPHPEWGETDFAKMDAHVITAEEYEEIPELTDEWFDRATYYVNGVPVKRGRPKAEVTKTPVNIRLSAEVVAHFKAGGPGWQTRIDETLKRHVRRAAGKARKTEKKAG